MNAQMTTIETVTVVRPLKVISLVCMIVSLFLLILSLFTTYWLKTRSFHTGLLIECVDNVSGAGLHPLNFGPSPGKCQPRSKHSTFTNIIFSLMCIGCIARILGIFTNIMALRSNDLHKKFVFYKSATYLTFLTVITEVISLVGFPIIFFYTMNEYGVRYWEFDWSYGVAFSATLIELGALLLLICDKEHEEVYHKEKTIYNPPPDFA